MSLFEVTRQVGTWRLLLFTGSLVLFVVLHVVRIPLVLLASVLATAAGVVDGCATRQASSPPRGPVNDFYAHAGRKGACDVGA